MSTKQTLARVFLPIVMLLPLAGAFAAQRSDSPSLRQREFLLRSPEDRMQGWRDGLLKFVTEHRDLTDEQGYAIENLADIGNPTSFSFALEPRTRELFAKRLSELGRVLSHQDYLGMLRSFDDELRVWLVHNGLASKEETNTPTCNCGDIQDCSGGTCSNVTCIHEGGTSHNGRCATSTEIE